MFRPATLLERKEYYSSQFDFEKSLDWFFRNGFQSPQIFAIDMGSETKIILDKKKIGKMINLIPRKIGQKMIKYLPEDVYYDRNIYLNPEIVLNSLDFKGVWKTDNLLGQELAFDIDADNIKCDCRNKLCEKCLCAAVLESIKLAEKLGNDFEKISLIYSGRGMHVHVFDSSTFGLSIREREAIINKFKKFSIDRWVSRGYIRLMRLPYSLNGLVNRIVLPLTIKQAEKFNPWIDESAKPDYSSSSSFL